MAFRETKQQQQHQRLDGNARCGHPSYEPFDRASFKYDLWHIINEPTRHIARAHRHTQTTWPLRRGGGVYTFKLNKYTVLAH